MQKQHFLILTNMNNPLNTYSGPTAVRMLRVVVQVLPLSKCYALLFKSYRCTNVTRCCSSPTAVRMLCVVVQVLPLLLFTTWTYSVELLATVNSLMWLLKGKWAWLLYNKKVWWWAYIAISRESTNFIAHNNDSKWSDITLHKTVTNQWFH